MRRRAPIPAGWRPLRAAVPILTALCGCDSACALLASRNHPAPAALVARAAEAEGTQLALHTGDMVVNAADAQLWSRWFAEERDLLLRTPFVPTLGNHEITDNGAAYSKYFQGPDRPAYRSLDYGP